MAPRKLMRELLASGLIGVFSTMALAQSLGDLARDQRQKKASTAQSTAGRQSFSNIDNPPTQASSANRQTAGKAIASEQPLLLIDSPADGTVVSPGQTIHVRVTSLTDKKVAFVGVIGQDPLPATEIRDSLPTEFSIAIPPTIERAGRYSLTAMGRTAAGELVESDPVDIDVERSDMPLSLRELNLSGLSLQAQGATYNLEMLAIFSDGQVLDIRESKNLSFHSTDTRIVTVDASGTARAVATGSASIIASYRNSDGPDVRFTFPVTVVPFQVTFAPRSLEFGRVPVGRSISLTITLTNSSMSDSELRITQVTATPPYTEISNCISSSPLGLDGTCKITVTFAPAAEGERSGTLTVHDSFIGVPSEILLSGIGVK